MSWSLLDRYGISISVRQRGRWIDSSWSPTLALLHWVDYLGFQAILERLARIMLQFAAQKTLDGNPEGARLWLSRYEKLMELSKQ